MPRRYERRGIVDTNCWISFLIGKRLSRLVDLLSNERVRLVICDELLEEIREVTTRPKFAKYFPKAEDYLLALAIEARAHFLVTGDQDLLVLRDVKNCRIVDATTFEQIMK